MDHQKSKTTFSAILPVLILMVAAFWVSSAVGAEQKNILTSSKYFILCWKVAFAILGAKVTYLRHVLKYRQMVAY